MTDQERNEPARDYKVLFLAKAEGMTTQGISVAIHQTVVSFTSYSEAIEALAVMESSKDVTCRALFRIASEDVQEQSSRQLAQLQSYANLGWPPR